MMKQESLYIVFSVLALSITIVAFVAASLYQSNDIYSDISSSQKKILSLTALQKEESHKILLLKGEIERSNTFYEETQKELQTTLLTHNKTNQDISMLEDDLALAKQQNANLKKELSNLVARLP